MFINSFTCVNCDGRGIVEHWEVVEPGLAKVTEVDCPVCNGKGYTAQPAFTVEEAEVIAEHFGFNIIRDGINE